MISNEFESLLDDYLDGNRSPEVIDRLRAQLTGNEANTQLYVRRMFLHQQLHAALVAEIAVECLSVNQQSAKKPVVLKSLDGVGSSIARFSRFSSWGMVAVISSIIGAATWLVLSRTPSVENRPTARISGASQRQTKGTGEVSALPTISSLQSRDTATTLRLDGIGYITIHGQTDFCLVGPKRARLNYGQIKVRVTETTGHGFVIETPDGEVTDLGTEFALDVSQGNDSSLVVHEGKVDLRVGSSQRLNDPERLVGGEAILFNSTGTIQRLMSIVSDEFEGNDDTRKSNGTVSSPLITCVTDNLRHGETRGFYEIVPRGLREDALSNVDGRHEWNGVDGNGMPAYLVGADYVKTFITKKKLRKTNVSVTLSRPVKLYVFWCDERESPHEWLLREFQPTGDFIGLDADWPAKGKDRSRLSKGPGKSIDMKYSIWVREITTPGVVVLGAGIDPSKSGTYGIAAVPLFAPVGEAPSNTGD